MQEAAKFEFGAVQKLESNKEIGLEKTPRIYRRKSCVDVGSAIGKREKLKKTSAKHHSSPATRRRSVPLSIL